MPNRSEHWSNGRTDIASIEVSDSDGVTVVGVTGEIDISNIDHLAEAISSLRNGSDGLIVNLVDARYIDSTAVSLLHDLAMRLRQRAQRLVVACPPGSPPRRILELTALHLNAALADDLMTAMRIARGEPGSI